MNAIIIEDEYLAAAELERLLGEVAPEITILTKLDSVSESVKWLKKNKADVIFMDIMMPYMNGWDATRKIRTLQRPDADKIPIIAMSANAFAEDIINSHISGMNWHLTKPIDADKLMTALKECIRKNNIR